MDEELSLPSLPETKTYSEPHLPTSLRPAFNPLRVPNPRKRSSRTDKLASNEVDLLATSLHTSSDPALFSSDETPDAENYVGGKRRKKKHYAGTWWGEKLTRSQLSRSGSPMDSGSETSSRRDSGTRRTPVIMGSRIKRQFTRNFDSGVFMNSDDSRGSSELEVDLSSDSSLGNELFEDQRRLREREQEKILSTPPRRPTTLPLTGTNSPVRKFLAGPDVKQSAQSPVSPGRIRYVRQEVRPDDVQQQVIRIVRQCVEDGKENVDLSSMGLEILPLEVQELSTMVSNDKADQMLFDSLVARPRLFLANNLLREVPSMLLDLTNLRQLSLRQNKLTRLPPGIRNLIKLEELNIAGNRLKVLPIEVLDLVAHHRLRRIHSEPNPWMAPPPKKDAQNVWAASLRLSKRRQLQTAEVAKAEGISGIVLEIMASTETSRPKAQVAALSELVLRSLSKINSSKVDLSSEMHPDTPQFVTDMLHDLHTAQTEGGRQCVDCQRHYVRPTVSWVEWWRTSAGVNNHLELLPFEAGICGGCHSSN